MLSTELGRQEVTVGKGRQEAAGTQDDRQQAAAGAGAGAAELPSSELSRSLISFASVASYADEEVKVHSRRPLRIFGSVVPIVYLASLPFLTKLTISSDGTTFAYRCANFPHCKDSMLGVSLPSLIHTPQATGAMFAVFFWPVLHLWLPGAVLSKKEAQISTITLLVMVLCFSARLLAYERHPCLNIMWQVSMLAHFFVMLRQCHRRRRPWCVAVLSLMLTGFFFLAVFAIIGWWTGTWVRDTLPWASYVTTVVVLSAFSLFPLCWHRAKPLSPPRQGVADASEVTRAGVIDNGMSSLPIKICGSLIAILYVWSMPLLAHFDILVHRCNQYPKCIDDDGTGIGPSVSSYICTPAATGVMGVTFFWPIMHFWMPGAQAPESKLSYLFLVLFQLNFGAFLVFPVEVLPMAHFLVVGSFCISALLHFALTSKYCLDKYFYGALLCLAVACLMIIALVGITVAGVILPGLRQRNPFLLWLFYLCEAVGLTAIIAFPLVWRRDQTKWQGQEPVMSMSFAGLRGNLLSFVIHRRPGITLTP